MIDFNGLSRQKTIDKVKLWFKNNGGMNRAQRLECVLWVAITCGIYRFFG